MLFALHADSDSFPSLQAHQGTVRCVAFHHEGEKTLLATCSDDTTVRLWDVSAATASTGTSATTRPAYLTASSSITDGAACSTADGTPSCTATYMGFKGIVYGVAFTPEVVTYVGRRLPTKLATACGDKVRARGKARIKLHPYVQRQGAY